MRRLGRVRRRFGFDRNDLRRTVDRRQWAVGVGAAALFTVLAPPSSAILGADAYYSGVKAEHRYVHRITAQITRIDSQGGAGLHHTYAELVWTSLDGRPRTTVVPADKSVRPGMGHQIWVDAAGNPVRRPQTRTDTLATTSVAAAMALTVVGLPLLSVYLLVRRRCDRRRDCLWDESWTALAHH
ncbi:Rv1733c family protein [Spirillospora sp. CA-128828]|uniref:Rv1733c family protein n=1 Tax=Spirillospora sp. CA-128828 TaxID=3240033 RepID=UPI003D89BD3B